MLHSAIRDPLNRLCCPMLRDSPLIDKNEFVCQPTKVGDSILICGRRKSYFPFQCLVGPDWPIVILVYFLIIAIDGIVLYIVSPLGWIPVMLGGIGAVAVLIFYSMVACSDPGIIYKNDYTPMSELTPLGADIEAHNHGISSHHSNSNEECISNHDHKSSHSANAIVDASGVIVIGGSGNGSEKNPVVTIQDGNTSSPTPAYVVQSSSSPSTVIQRRDPNKLIEIPQTMDCGNCEFKRPLTARHCIHCKTCIDELDHHCPW